MRLLRPENKRSFVMGPHSRKRIDDGDAPGALYAVFMSWAYNSRTSTTGSSMASALNRQALLPLTLGAVGVVYGDIGTSPLYTMSTIFGEAGVPLDARHLVGAASTIFWALMMVVTLKYVVLVLRADNRGEGGIMALTALAVAAAGKTAQRRTLLLMLGLFGAALFYGDSVITPAMSVLSAIEGLEVDPAGPEALRAADLDRRAARRCSSSSARAPARSAGCSAR